MTYLSVPRSLVIKTSSRSVDYRAQTLCPLFMDELEITSSLERVYTAGYIDTTAVINIMTDRCITCMRLEMQKGVACLPRGSYQVRSEHQAILSGHGGNEDPYQTFMCCVRLP